MLDMTTLPTPDWHDDKYGIALYHSDCMDVLPLLPRVDAVTISDPPFNIGYGYEGYSDKMDEDDYWAWLETVLSCPVCLIHYPEMLFKFAFQVGKFPDDCMAWVYHANTAKQWRMAAWFGIAPDFSLVKQPYRNNTDKRIKQLVANGSGGCNSYNWMCYEQVKNVSAEKTIHPCQMPTKVMKQIVGVTPCHTIIDPFLGSGTTGVACVNLDRAFIGIEKERKYFDIAVKRIREAIITKENGPLFAKHKPAQAEMFDKQT